MRLLGIQLVNFDVARMNSRTGLGLSVYSFYGPSFESRTTNSIHHRTTTCRWLAQFLDAETATSGLVMIDVDKNDALTMMSKGLTQWSMDG